GGISGRILRRTAAIAVGHVSHGCVCVCIGGAGDDGVRTSARHAGGGHLILRGCEEILSEGGSEGRERRIFGYTGSTLPTEGRRNHRPRCATNRTVWAIGLSPAGVTEDPSLPPLRPTPLRISSQPPPATAPKELS